MKKYIRNGRLWGVPYAIALVAILGLLSALFTSFILTRMTYHKLSEPSRR